MGTHLIERLRLCIDQSAPARQEGNGYPGIPVPPVMPKICPVR